jgi:hypothetical protein
MIRIWILVLVGCILAACGGSGVRDYEGQAPAFDMQQFFDGELQAWGMIQSRSGKVLGRFRVDMLGRWEGDRGVLEEDFVYLDSGRTERRVWTLHKQADGGYTGTAADVIKPASGQAAGFALNWRYRLAVPLGDKTIGVDFDDWMYLMDSCRLINRAGMHKFGVRVAEVTLWIEKSGCR